MIFRFFLLLHFVAVTVLGAAVVDPHATAQHSSIDPNDARYVHNTRGKLQLTIQGANRTSDDPENPITKEGWKCVFPFKFKGQWYYGCTTYHYGIAWCSTVEEFDWNIDHMGYCQNNTALTKPVTTNSGKQCQIPFTYEEYVFGYGLQSYKFYGCTTYGDLPWNRTWCMVEDKKSGNTTKELCFDELVSQLGDAVVEPNDARNLKTNRHKYVAKDEHQQSVNETLDSENAITTEEEKCVFPFKFNGDWYSGCITTKNFLSPWCSTVRVFDFKNHHWGYCENNTALTKPMTTYSGKPCHIPFTYKGVDYYGCTTFDNLRHRSWCMVDNEATGNATTTKELCRDELVSILGVDQNATAKHSSIDPNDIGFILLAQNKFLEKDPDENTRPVDHEHAITKGGSKCVFPFLFQGEWYSGCTTKHFLGPWCSTVKVFDLRLEHMGYCKNNTAMIQPMTTYSGKRCHFPFTYQKIGYYGCTTVDHPRHRSWCMIKDEETGTATTTKDLCRDERNAEVDTYGGEAHGEKCHFPFVYEGKTYHGCTNDDDSNGQFWCLTKHKSWGYCNTIDSETNLKRQRTLTGEIYKNSSCVFPFVYNGQSYHGCTGRVPWCSKTANYDKDGMSKYCDDKDVISVATLSVSCTYPYLSNGTQWAEPFNMGSECANKYNLDGDHKLIPNKDNTPSPPVKKIPTNLSLGAKEICPMPWYHGTTSHIGCAVGKLYNWCPMKSPHDGPTDWWDCAFLDRLV